MKLSNEARRVVEGRKKKIRYDMKNISGGFSEGVDIMPGQHSGVMDISIDIYGGSKSTAHSYEVPPSIKQLQTAYIAATQKGDPVASDIKRQLEAYYTNLRRAISLHIVHLMQQFDSGANDAITSAVKKINSKY
tara:strand:- start:7408 stop:7809 length:402 start_codon:yes stop_codon:yes gene_type:complete